MRIIYSLLVAFCVIGNYGIYGQIKIENEQSLEKLILFEIDNGKDFFGKNYSEDFWDWKNENKIGAADFNLPFFVLLKAGENNKLIVHENFDFFNSKLGCTDKDIKSTMGLLFNNFSEVYSYSDDIDSMVTHTSLRQTWKKNFNKIFNLTEPYKIKPESDELDDNEINVYNDIKSFDKNSLRQIYLGYYPHWEGYDQKTIRLLIFRFAEEEMGNKIVNSENEFDLNANHESWYCITPYRLIRNCFSLSFRNMMENVYNNPLDFVDLDISDDNSSQLKIISLKKDEAQLLNVLKEHLEYVEFISSGGYYVPISID
ncbi:MAG: hypothetical protein KKA84_05235 [Bacteroidetes bacterium]|nr:hypothetical protein [Bacteroidota bacterium]